MQLSGRGPPLLLGGACVGGACMLGFRVPLVEGGGGVGCMGQGWEWEFPMNVINVIMGINWLKDSRNAH